MKFRILYTTAFAAFCYLVLLSSSAGPTGMIGDRTGSPLSGGFCNGCHDSPGTFDPSITITVEDSTNTPITNGLYKPGSTYSIKLVISSPPSLDSVIAQYGIQAVLLSTNNAQAGQLSNPTTGAGGTGAEAHIYTLSGGRSYLEHNQRCASGIFNVTWKAPAIGTGPVTLYAAGQAVDANAAFTGDNYTNTALTLGEDLSVGVDRIQAEALEYNLFPNPIVDGKFYIEGLEGEAVISVKDLVGRTVFQEDVSLGKEAYKLPIKAPSGLYFVQIRQGNKIGTKAIRLLE